MTNRRYVRLLVLGLVLASAVAACSRTPTPAPPPTALPTPGRPMLYERVDVPDVGLVVEIPSGWTREGTNWVWAPVEPSGIVLGLRWLDVRPPQEVEAAFLPAGGVVRDSKQIDLGWASGRYYVVDVTAQTPRVEEHVLFSEQSSGARRVFDLYLIAPDDARYMQLRPVLLHSLGSIAADEGRPTDPSAFLPLLPESAHFLDWKELDLDGAGGSDYVVLSGFGSSPGEPVAYDWLQLFVISQGPDGDLAIAFQSAPLLGDAASALQLVDLTGDGREEVLSPHTQSSEPFTLYVLSGHGSIVRLLRASGGHFDGQDRLGEHGVRLSDVDGDGLQDILAYHGPAGDADIYHWDGSTLAFLASLAEK